MNGQKVRSTFKSDKNRGQVQKKPGLYYLNDYYEIKFAVLKTYAKLSCHV